MNNSATMTLTQPAQIIDSKSKVILRETLSLVKMAASIAVPLLLLSLAWV
ncbi:hypothetical protein MD535_20570 [Vibrio sp. ZSDZ65]|uniref:Uncharacterized protein n=1 Tax=Vibrio qingdaonensis TaxID=2829491 RepID=A0A9X3HYK4_9VIBR|nr:hypothetical protein [Vibrio qingdaonensis]MCW8348383.1 hypothetical protein [Vibrio qingdaonensis]